MEYTVIQEADYSIFSQAVQTALNNGWKPQGGISIALNKTGRTFSNYYYAQAFIR